MQRVEDVQPLQEKPSVVAAELIDRGAVPVRVPALLLHDDGHLVQQAIQLERGFEADVCFYVQSAAQMHGKIHIDPAVDPAPDLVIEIEMTSPALNKLPIFAAFGVPEVWRYDGRQLRILQLTGSEYIESPKSLAFPGASSAELSQLVQQSMSLKRREWLQVLRNWVRELR